MAMKIAHVITWLMYHLYIIALSTIAIVMLGAIVGTLLGY